MLAPHVHVPFDLVREHADFIRARRLNLELFFSGGLIDRLEPAEIDRVMGVLDYGPSISIHAPFMDLSPGAVDSKVLRVTRERYSQVFDIAEVIRPKAIVFHSGYEKWKYDHKVALWLEGCLRMWPGFIERASSLGAKIAIENIFEDTPENLSLLMGEIPSPHFGICFDTGHFHLFSKAPLSEWLDALGPRIVELHLHDNEKGYDSHLPIGEGTFDFDGFFGLFGRGDVIFTIEAHSPEGALKSMEALAGYHQRLSA